MKSLPRVFTLSSLFLVSVLPLQSALASAPLAPAPKACLTETARAAAKNDPQVRATASKGLAFLAQSSRAWTQPSGGRPPTVQRRDFRSAVTGSRADV